MQKRRILTGITTSGTPHLGNYVGAIRPAIAASRRADAESFYFLADYHALVKCDDPTRVQRSTLEIAASWLACGLDPGKVYFYRQSDIAEIPELTWLLTCVTAKGLLNRAHAYKAAVDANLAREDDADSGINAGLYMYPVLMAADILIFNAHEVPVGRDQVQHIEMARDIAQRFNHQYRSGYFVLPEARIEDNVATLPGTDGRKMSKSYDNTIPLWLPTLELKKAILGIVTDSRAPGEPKDPDTSNLFAIYQAFAGAEESAAMRAAFAAGIGWGEAKQQLFERIDRELVPLRARYEGLIADPGAIEALLQSGAAKARTRSRALLDKLRWAVGLRNLSDHSVAASAAERFSKVQPLGTGAATVSSAPPQIKSYRAADGKFYFKLSAADGTLLLQSRGFDSPKEVGQLTAAMVQASDDADALCTLLLRSAPAAELALPTSAIVAALAHLKADELSKEREKN